MSGVMASQRSSLVDNERRSSLRRFAFAEYYEVENLRHRARGPDAAPDPPSGLTSITPGTDTIQSALDTGGAGAKFSLNGTYTLTASVKPYNNQELYNVGTTVIQPSGAVDWAIRTDTGRGAGFLMHGLEIKDFDLYGYWQLNVLDTTVQWCYIHDNGGGGAQGSLKPANIHGGQEGGLIVRDSIIYRGYELGIIAQAGDEVIENCEISYNNTSQTSWSSATGDASGVKSHSSAGTVHRWNWVHHNNGPGLWCDDLSNGAFTFEYNLVEETWQLAAPGIMYEISNYATAKNPIRRNVIRNLDHYAIYVSESEDAMVQSNWIEGCEQGLICIEDTRSQVLGDVEFRYNYVYQQDLGADPIAAAQSIYLTPGGPDPVFNYNYYLIDSGISTPFEIDGTKKTVAQWTTTYPNDYISTF